MQQFFDRDPDSRYDSVYFIITCDFGTVLVSPEVAAHLRGQLDRCWPPWWVEFQTLFGARVRVQSRTIVAIAESTSAHRSAARRFWCALDDEAGDTGPGCL